MFMIRWILLCALLRIGRSKMREEDQPDFLVLTFIDEETDSFRRFIRSSKVYGIDVKILKNKDNLPCKDTDAKQEYCEKQENTRTELLKQQLKQFNNKKNLIIMILDSPHVLFNSDKEEIIKAFLNQNAPVLFAAAEESLVDPELQSKFPDVHTGMQYLSSTASMGYPSNLYDLVTDAQNRNLTLSHQYFVWSYIEEEKRQKYGIKIDHTADIFDVLYEERDYQEIEYEEEYAYVSNNVFNSRPSVIIANDKHQHSLNVVGDYIAKAYHENEECLECLESNIDLDNVKETEYPLVLMGVFVEEASPFFEEFLVDLFNLNYPKDRIHLYIHMANQYNEKEMKEYLEENGDEYRSVTYSGISENITELDARNQAIRICVEKRCDYYFNVDAPAHLDNNQTLRLLIQQNRTIVAPLLAKKYKSQIRNFQRQVTTDGFEVRAFDEKDIRRSYIRGTWNVGCVTDCYLINGSLLHTNNKPLFKYDAIISHVTFCHDMRTKGIFMYLSNRFDFGHLVVNNQFNTSNVHNEMYELFNNRWDWRQRYIVSNYTNNLEENHTPDQPCTDVFWFPVFTPRFCTELIDIMEGHGTWYDGRTYFDPVIEGYDDYPTFDIYLMKVGLLEHWQRIVKKYVLPLQEKVYPGYESEGPEVNKSYVIKYSQEGIPEQASHDDGSLFTLNVALNEPGVDYEGGGVKFLRYNCSVVDSRVGWLLMHPGQLTHYHQGLPTTKGTRYILVSLVDPPE